MRWLYTGNAVVGYKIINMQAKLSESNDANKFIQRALFNYAASNVFGFMLPSFSMKF